MDIRRAMAQLATVHAQILRSETFRGYRAATMAATAVLAAVAASLQTFLWPATMWTSFVGYWAGVAVLGGVLCVADLVRLTARRPETGRRVGVVVAQSGAPVAAGALLTLLAVWRIEALAPLMPGFWALLFGLSILATRPFLPRTVGFVGLFYLLAGGVLLAGAPGLPSPWAVGLPFGAGQAALAWALRMDVRRRSAGD